MNRDLSRNPFQIVVLLSGRGSNLEALAASLPAFPRPTAIAGVVSDRVGAPGLAIAEQRGIPTAVVLRRAKERSVEAFEEELAERVLAHQPNLIILAGFMRVLTPHFITRCGPSIINIHPSLLPAFRGMDAQQQALDAGVKFSGCTVHVVIPELDSGPILAQSVVPVLPNDTRDSLADRILAEEHILLPATAASLAAGKLTLSQSDTGSIVVREADVYGHDPGVTLRSCFALASAPPWPP